jgi:CRISPR system Cascade subunit CasD
MSNTLFLRLEGPMQSWGERGRWSVRDTAPEPTKSGVIGLLACALGTADDGEIRQLSSQLRMGVRCDAPGVSLADYHTIGGGYEEPMLLTAEGKPKKSSGRPHTELSTRHYLCDASFLVALLGDPLLVQRLADVVQSPVWPLYLGRRSCPPSRPVFAGVGDYASLEEALRSSPWRPEADAISSQTAVRAVIETDSSEGVRRRDAILSLQHRTYGPRYTRDIRIDVPNPREA